MSNLTHPTKTQLRYSTIGELPVDFEPSEENPLFIEVPYYKMRHSTQVGYLIPESITLLNEAPSTTLGADLFQVGKAVNQGTFFLHPVGQEAVTNEAEQELFEAAIPVTAQNTIIEDFVPVTFDPDMPGLS